MQIDPALLSMMLLQRPDVRTVVGAPECFHSSTPAGERNIAHLRDFSEIYALTENGSPYNMSDREAFDEAQGDIEFVFAFSVPRGSHSQLLALKAKSPLPA